LNFLSITSRGVHASTLPHDFSLITFGEIVKQLVAGRWAGFGIAGNFAGHLEQAGEVRDFASLKQTGEGPKGMFPFHLSIEGHFLSTDPISSSNLALPEGAQVQCEPEVALACELHYGPGNAVKVRPWAFAAFDDASIRREGAAKISHKKNWGLGSKGLSSRWIELPDGLDSGSVLDRYRIASFLGRGEDWHAYGVDSPVAGYTLYGPALVAWIEQKLSSQADQGPLEDLPALLLKAGRPECAVISIGATRYTNLGESTYLQPGDSFAVAVYDPEQVDAARLPELCAQGESCDGVSLLVRKAYRV
jgi:hypothetical protein